MFWPKKSREEIHRAVFDALAANLSYSRGEVLGFPGSFLDREVFPAAPFLREMPFLSCLRENPNHIGCHTVTQSETAFVGTQQLELELLRICAEQIMRAPPGGFDGYVCGGGTECNIEALWVQRNRRRHQGGGGLAVLYSEDAHYSIPKACDLLGLMALPVAVDERTRQLSPDALRAQASQARARGVDALVLVLTMGTTMFGSVDDIDAACGVLDTINVDYRVHVDAAFGGFIYPFTSPACRLDFRHPRVDSITMDGHKMLQAPYGTGVFLAREGLIGHVCTEEASYVHGKDYTLCGSRSGANAVGLWMILHSYGSEGGAAFLRGLLGRTDALCAGLDRLGVEYFRDPAMNVVTMRASCVPPAVAERYMLVPDRHGAPRWWKAVVMDHVEDATLARFLGDLGAARVAAGRPLQGPAPRG